MMSMTSLTVADINNRACLNKANLEVGKLTKQRSTKREKKAPRLFSIIKSLIPLIYDF